MRHVTPALFAALAVLAVASPAGATVHVHEKANIQIWTPDRWPVETSPDVVTVTQPQGECAVVFVVLEVAEIDAAMDALDDELGKFVKDVQVDGDPEQTKINGMDAILVDAKGKVEGKKVDVGLLLLQTPAKKVLMMLAICDSTKVKKHTPTFLRMMKSLKPAPKKFG